MKKHLLLLCLVLGGFGLTQTARADDDIYSTSDGEATADGGQQKTAGQDKPRDDDAFYGVKDNDGGQQ